MNNFFKAEELVKLLKVSERTIYRFVEEAKLGTLNVRLINRGEKMFIAKDESNLRTLKKIVSDRQKYKNRKSLKIIEASEEFYHVFADNHIFDLLKSIEIKREVPLKYSYLNGGAKSWDEYVNKMWSAEDSIDFPKTKELVDYVSGYISKLILGYDKVNIIDIGPGNGLPVKNILNKLLKESKLNKYIAIDISQEMLNILERNISEWFNGEVDFTGIVGDITRDTFQSTAFRNLSYDGEKASIINIILYLGGSIENDINYSQQLRIINSSMGSNDIFLLEQGIDHTSKEFKFNFGKAQSDSANSDLAHRKMILDLLNIEEDFYNVERYYSEQEKAKIINIRFVKDIIVNIKSKTISRKLVFQKGDILTIWRYNCHSSMEVLEELDRCGFRTLLSITSENKESAIFLSEIKKYT